MIYKSLFPLALVLASSQIYDFEWMGRNPTLHEEGPSFEELTSDPLPSRPEVVEITRVPTCNPRFDCTLIVGIRGEITHTTVTQLNRIIDKTRRQAEADKVSFHFGAVELNSPGGSVNAAMAIGRIVRKEEAGAFVNRGAVCLSSCVLILAGGSFRSFEGKVGIHRPYLPVPSGDVSSQNVKAIYAQMLQDLRAYFREMNVADGLADAMLRTNPEKIRLLSEDELANYGLTPV
jgi:ATP-dependent protease ClpP protease subunit